MLQPQADPQQQQQQNSDAPLWQQIDQLEQQLSYALRNVPLPSEVVAMYDPIEYARELHLAYMERFLNGPKPVLFLGMNPGPWGMCQTGVPFGHVPSVRDWMQLRGEVLKPLGELAIRPVEGLQCTRSEQSGSRWWGLFQDVCGTPERFFRNCFVYNICPLAFFKASGANVTPAELKGSKAQIKQISCDYLVRALELIQPTIVVSVGRYVDDCVKALVKQRRLDPNRMQFKYMPHPSPRSLNNTDWPQKARRWLEENGVMPYLRD